MPFRYVVEAATHLSAARAHVLDGRLESGTIRNGVRAIAQTVRGPVPIVIRSVAFVHRSTVDPTLVTLQIEPPPVPLDELVGAVVEDDDA